MSKKAYAEMSAATLLYGLTFPLTAIVLRDMGPLYLSSIRSFWPFIFFILYFLKRGYPENPNYALLLSISLFGLVLPLVLQNVGMLYTTASLASIIQSTAPIFVVFLAFFLLKEKLTLPKILGVLIGIAGIVVVVGVEEGSMLLGNILITCAAISLALLAIFEKIALSKHTPVEILGITSIMGFPILLTLLPFESLPSFTTSSVILTIILSLGCTVLPYFLWLDGLKNLEVSRAIVFSYGIPAFGILFSIALLNETVTLRMIAGMAVIFFSIWISQK
ncbi:MAG: DMT family transporter [Candidatus Thermoplasmatota archaeon]|nr:DMT family transporter [Candidatus Thermoplasmatota archaeon]